MKLNLGPITLGIEGIKLEEIPANTRLFLTEEEATADLTYYLHGVTALPGPSEPWKITFQRPDICVWENGALEARRLAVGNPDAAYALYQERNEKEVDVYFLESWRHELVVDTIFVSCLALEKQMAKKGAYILHSCFLQYQEQAILFSGPSGIGKSTHANLWCRYIDHTHVVNGDRTLIYTDDQGQYWASAWPVCGSSQICLKEAYPLKAIVFLGQAPHNEVMRLSPMQLFKQLSSQITINWWNKPQVNRALDALQRMLGKVPMTHYVCNLTEEAPTTLYNHLKEKAWIN